MADAYELLVSADLPDDLSDAEVVELRWHLGAGPEPAEPAIVTDYDEVVVGEDGRPEMDADGEWIVERRARPVLAERGPAWRIGGVLSGELARRDGTARPGWALSCRQELHPDDFGHATALLRWLEARAGSPWFRCHVRFYEDQEMTVFDHRDYDEFE